MVKINVTYEGELNCKAEHELSKKILYTDAPPDNQGKGASFSPTDLVATALGTCYLTIMGIAARGRSIDMKGTICHVEKYMSEDAPRRISRLAVEVIFPPGISAEQREILELAAKNCPVTRSLHPDVKIDAKFH
jgi:putative redox protein